jgi:Mlc titration factor MtfA (ptsG expression regulator)
VQKNRGLNLKIPLCGFRRFTDLRAADESGVPRLLNTCGAMDPAEFFAVSVEAFFEQPRALRARHPKLYAELRTYFQQDPVEFSSEQTDGNIGL